MHFVFRVSSMNLKLMSFFLPFASCQTLWRGADISLQAVNVPANGQYGLSVWQNIYVYFFHVHTCALLFLHTCALIFIMFLHTCAFTAF